MIREYWPARPELIVEGATDGVPEPGRRHHPVRALRGPDPGVYRGDYDDAAQAAGHDLPFHGPGVAQQEAAQHTLARARSQLQEAGERASATVRSAEDQAPNHRDFHSEFADGASDVVDAIGAWFSAHGDELGSALQHGGETALGTLGMLGGGAVMAAGFGGEVGELRSAPPDSGQPSVFRSMSPVRA